MEYSEKEKQIKSYVHWSKTELVNRVNRRRDYVNVCSLKSLFLKFSVKYNKREVMKIK